MASEHTTPSTLVAIVVPFASKEMPDAQLRGKASSICGNGRTTLASPARFNFSGTFELSDECNLTGFSMAAELGASVGTVYEAWRRLSKIHH
jgi:hypothetical protein